MRHCAECHGELQVRELACPACELQMRGEFHLPRLARLSGAHLALAEALVLAGGNLKAVAQSLDVSYPTVRKRLDDLIAELSALRHADEQRIDGILGAIESGALAAAKGTRMIRALNGVDAGASPAAPK